MQQNAVPPTSRTPSSTIASGLDDGREDGEEHGEGSSQIGTVEAPCF